MKRQRVSLARLGEVANPERAAYRYFSSDPMEFDVEVAWWTNRAAMAKSIRMQQRRAPTSRDWRAVVRLGEIEGY